jgi:ELWxxDGT repeat protein
VLVKDIVAGPGGSNAFPEASLGGLLFFRASEPATGQELWRTDGTEAGTFVQEVVPGPGSAVFSDSLPAAGDRALMAAGDRVVFAAGDGVHGIEPWASDGFTTHLVGDINPGPASSLCCGDRFPFRPLLGTASGLAIMSADDGVDGFEMWATDGQTARLVGDIAAAVPSSFPGVTIAAGRNIFFQANDNRVGAELWAITRSGLRRLFNLGD